MKRNVSVVSLIVATRSSNILISGKIIKEMPVSVASGTHSINSTNIPPIMIINRIYENHNLLSLYLVPGWAKNLSAPLYIPL